MINLDLDVHVGKRLYSVGAPLRKHSVKKVDRPDRVEGAKKRHRLAGRASPTPPSGRLIRHKALVKSHS